MWRIYPGTILTTEELYQFREVRQLPPLPFRHNSALRTFAQICSSRVTKEYSPPRLYSWESVNPKVTAQHQNPLNYGSSRRFRNYPGRVDASLHQVYSETPAAFCTRRHPPP